ncbi:MAG: hypothetical protein WBX26_13390 [Candidatus Cybelea sp.]
MPRMRYLRTLRMRERKPRRLGNLFERESVELWRDIALEAGLLSPTPMLARPVAIAAMSVPDRLAMLAVYDGAAAWIIARSGLRCEHLASRFDRSQPVLARGK